MTADLSSRSPASLPEGVMMAELRHRTSNMFQLVGGVLSNAAAAERGSARLALQRAGAQLAAFALLDEQLAHGCEGEDGPCLSMYLSRLCGHLSDAALAPRGIELSFTGVELLRTEPRRCRHLGLAVTELVINAAKHAFPDGRRGRVVVELVAEDDVVVRVTDDGRGFVEPAGDGRQGMGFVSRLAAAADAELRRVHVDRGTSFELLLGGDGDAGRRRR